MLETVGFTVLSIISDNNRINRNMFIKLCGSDEIKICIPNPINPDKKLFLLFDSVHLIKSIRNNWVNQKDDDKIFIIPDPIQYFSPEIASTSNERSIKTVTASFSLSKKIYQDKSNTLLKFAPKLNLKALNPRNIERQNVSLALD